MALAFAEEVKKAFPKKEQKISILDGGTGPGRDLLFFKNIEGINEAVGMDACEAFCQ